MHIICPNPYESRQKSAKGYILTNSLEINGAVSLFYPGVAKAVAQALESDFYFACTSIHEVQIHSVEMVPPEVIGNSLHDTNKHCNRREEDCWMITPSGKVRFDLTK